MEAVIMVEEAVFGVRDWQTCEAEDDSLTPLGRKPRLTLSDFRGQRVVADDH